MKILELINKKTSLQIYVTLLAKKEIEYTTKECLLSQMPFKCDRATFRRHIINLLDSGLLVCEHYETYKIIKLADPSIAPPTPEKPIPTKPTPKPATKKNLKPADEKIIYAQYDNHTVKLKEVEHQKLLDKLGKELLEKVIDKLLKYKASKNEKYASDYMAIHSWVIKQVKKDIANDIQQLNFRDQKHAQFTQNMKELSQ